MTHAAEVSTITGKETTMNHQGRAGLYVGELLRELDTSARDEVSLRHPMTFGEIVGRDQVERLAAAADGIFSEVEPTHAWSGADIGGREWHGRFQDRQIRGVTVARRFGMRRNRTFAAGPAVPPYLQDTRLGSLNLETAPPFRYDGYADELPRLLCRSAFRTASARGPSGSLLF